MLEPFFIKALIAGLGIAFATATIGVFVLWKRMSYFGDAISHSSIFGLGIATIIAVEPMYGIILCAIIFCFLISLLNHRNSYSSDSIIVIVSCILLSFGMILIAIFPSTVDLESYLFGELMALGNKDLFIIYVVAALAIFVISIGFKKLLLSAINTDLAKVSGINVKTLELTFSLLTALVVASLVKIVGIFLITSLMIMPAAIARNFSKTPSQMLFIAIFVSVIIIICGLFIALIFNLPSSPSIIAFASVLLVGSIAFSTNAQTK